MPEIKEKDQAVTEVKLAGEPAQEKPRTRKKASTKPEAPENTLPDDPEAARLCREYLAGHTELVIEEVSGDGTDDTMDYPAAEPVGGAHVGRHA